jgi:dTDP-4-dehydrorhamnose 3,5-epimerase
MTELSDDKQIFVPGGFAHGYATLADNTEVIYKVTDFYAPDSDAGLRWNDPTIAIDWRLPQGIVPTLSSRDAGLPLLRDFSSPFLFGPDDVPLRALQEVEL